jgi:hypothetical protein
MNSERRRVIPPPMAASHHCQPWPAGWWHAGSSKATISLSLQAARRRLRAKLQVEPLMVQRRVKAAGQRP